jgi:hypothetical protein
VVEFFEGEVSVKTLSILIGKLSIKGRSTCPYIWRGENTAEDYANALFNLISIQGTG